MADSANTTRRAFLKSAPLAAAAISMPAVAVAVERVKPQTPQEKLDQAFEAMEAAMTEIHGEGVRITRNDNHLLCVMEPHRPRIVEFAGPGYYEVEICKDLHPIYWVERAPENDHSTEGRCFRLTPRNAKHLGKHYSFEWYLRTVLIRKI